MVFLALEALVGHVESRGESRSHAWQPRVRSMTHGEEGLGSLLVGGRSSTEAKTRDDARGINGHEQTETFVPSQAVGPSNVCASGQPSFAPTLGIPDGHSRAVQGLVGASLRLHHLCQMQAYLLDETHSVAHQPVELRVLGQGGEGIAQLGLGIAVEVPLAPKACPSGEDGEGYDLAGAQGCIWSGVLFFLRAGVAEVVDHNVECGEEGVHVDHESTGPFPSGNGIGKPTLMGGHLPLNFRSSNSHQTFKEPRPTVRLVPEPLAQLVAGVAPYELAAGPLVHPLGFLESVADAVVSVLLLAAVVGHPARHVGEGAAVWKASMNRKRIRSGVSISTSLRTTGPIRMPTTISGTTEARL